MAEKRTAPDADTGANINPQPAANLAPDAVGPSSVGDRVTSGGAPDDLNPMDMAGKGQSLSPVEQAQADTIAAREQAKLEAAEMVRKAEADALQAQRDSVLAEQERRREQAVKQAAESREAIQAQRAGLQSFAVDPVSLALEAAHSNMMAAALMQDETVPGGYYVVSGRVQDANGTDLGPAPRG